MKTISKCSQSGPAGAWGGIVPDENLHRTVLRVEKKTGLAVDAAKRIQGHSRIFFFLTCSTKKANIY